MSAVQLARVVYFDEDYPQAQSLTHKAYTLEAQAAGLIPVDEASEPTRSILYRSAASLAYQCKEYQVAQQLIGQALIGFPPAEILQELTDLLILISNSLSVAWGSLPSNEVAGLMLKEVDYWPVGTTSILPISHEQLRRDNG